MSTKAQKLEEEKLEEEKQNSIEWLRKTLPVGSTVFGSVVHAYPSGMGRVMTFHKLREDDATGLDYDIGIVLGHKHHKRHEGLVIVEAGMDMIWYTVYRLSEALYGTDDALKSRRLI